jgi:hypothetical protein
MKVKIGERIFICSDSPDGTERWSGPDPLIVRKLQDALLDRREEVPVAEDTNPEQSQFIAAKTAFPDAMEEPNKETTE